MIPIKDSISSSRTPYVTIFLILSNLSVFFYELLLGRWELARFIYAYGLVPVRFFYLSTEGAALPIRYFPFFTSMFLHAGWFHILGNMLFLWIFGDNVEDEMGHFRYFIFYILCGLGAGFVHLFLNSSSNIPAIGASGAISGVMGAYIVLFPRARIITLFPIFFFFTFVEVSAFFFIAIWFIFQIFSGAFSLLIGRTAGAGVAWWAHVGGFVVGMGLVFVFAKRKRHYFSKW